MRARLAYQTAGLPGCMHTRLASQPVGIEDACTYVHQQLNGMQNAKDQGQCNNDNVGCQLQGQDILSMRRTVCAARVLACDSQQTVSGGYDL